MIQIFARTTYDSLEDLSDTLLENLTDDQLLDIIKYIDKGLQDWGFTRRVHDYFNEEMKNFEGD